MTVTTARHGVLLGMMGAGKTTVGRLVAERLGRPYRDSDLDIEAATGMTGADYAVAHGVAALHALEEQVLLDALAADEPAVIGAAGWVVESEACRAGLRERARVAWLDLPTQVLLPRIATGAHRRVIADDDLARLEARRTPLFAQVADVRLDAARPVEDLAADVARLFGDQPPLDWTRGAS